jgi:hypothetical protein
MIVDYWNCRHAHTLPVFYNHLLQGGYFNMPSARMGKEGELAFGYASVPPYLLWNGRFQLNDRLEISGNYRIFRGVIDPHLSSHGFGDLSDKGANVKFAIIRPEDSAYRLPGIALGFEDFLGTRNFKARYAVLTQVIDAYNLELSIGYGSQRIRHWFGGITWLPFYNNSNPYLQNIAFVAEYDATPYDDPAVELHPKGREQRSPINFGLKYRLWNTLDCSVACIRGRALAATLSAYYNFGESDGFLTKIDTPLFYRAPINREPIGGRRSVSLMTAELLFALRDQGFTLIDASLECEDDGSQTMRLHMLNDCYREERHVRQRLSYLLAALIPEGIDKVIAVMDAEGFPIQEYHIPVAFLRRYGDGYLCEPEFAVMAPQREVTKPAAGTYQEIYYNPLPLWRVCFAPNTNFYFGSAKGKLKFSLGASMCIDGFLWQQTYYNVVVNYNFLDDMHGSKSIDLLNPSQIINVRSDVLRYRQRTGLSVECAYLQKTWNLGQGWYGRTALGLFEIEYGGAAAEVLYYPVGSKWACGAEAACLRKRTLRGLGFSDKVRKLDGYCASYHGFLGSQFFLNGYYDWQAASLDLRLKVGKFLANDYGARYEITRYFPSGLRVAIWYTHTNAHDCINGERYYDKGVAISLPLDLFYTCCSRGTWGHGLSAWLRDIGIIGSTGRTLYDTIYQRRQ